MYPAVPTESQIPVTVTSPDHDQRPSSEPPIPAVPSPPPVESTPAIQPAPAVSPTPDIQPAPAVSPTPDIQPAPAVPQTPDIQPAPTVPQTPAPHPLLPLTPTTSIRRISVSRKYLKVVLFKHYEIINLRHQLIIIVTNLRDEDRIHVHKRINIKH